MGRARAGTEPASRAGGGDPHELPSMSVLAI